MCNSYPTFLFFLFSFIIQLVTIGTTITGHTIKRCYRIRWKLPRQTLMFFLIFCLKSKHTPIQTNFLLSKFPHWCIRLPERTSLEELKVCRRTRLGLMGFAVVLPALSRPAWAPCCRRMSIIRRNSDSSPSCAMRWMLGIKFCHQSKLCESIRFTLRCALVVRKSSRWFRLSKWFSNAATRWSWNYEEQSKKLQKSVALNL